MAFFWSLLPWFLVALMNFAAQLALRWELAPGEFGTMNAIIGLIGLIVAPALAFGQLLERENRPEILPATEVLVLFWALLTVPLLFLCLPLLELPLGSLDLLALLILVVALGGVVSGIIEQSRGVLRRWTWILVGAATVRALAGLAIGWATPRAEAGLAAILLAGFIALIPLLRPRDFERAKIMAALKSLDRDFLIRLATTISVAVGLYLFTSADRIFAQPNIGVPDTDHMGLVDHGMFDSYEAAGLLGRALLWGTQPLLALFFLERAALSRTTAASLKYFWIYLGVLILGAFALGTVGRQVTEIFSQGDSDSTWRYVPGFALAMVPLGILQALGTFSLASRRTPECFVIGGCGIAYSLPLYFAGKQPQLMLAYMFGGAVIALMAVLFVGVVRWGRRQP